MMKETQMRRRSRLLARSAPRAPQCTVAGMALLGVAGTSILASAEDLPFRLPFTDSQGRPQKIGAAGLKLIQEFEGLELTGYVLDDGMCTIGYGHAIPLSEKPAAECKQWTITNAQAEEFLKQDTERFANELNTYFTRSFTQNQFDALMSFSYNLGYVYEKWEWPKDAPDSYFPGVMILYTNPAWAKEGLTRRRQAEIALFENPNQPAADAVAEPAQTIPTTAFPAGESPETAPVTEFQVPGEFNQPTTTEPVVEQAPVAPAAEVPTVVVTQFPAIPPLFTGGLSAIGGSSAR